MSGNISDGYRQLTDADSQDVRLNIKDGVTVNPLYVTPELVNNMEGGKVTVGTTAVAMTFAAVTGSPIVTAHPDNTGLIFFGKSNVTNAGANSLGVLIAGGNATFEGYDDSSVAIYFVSDTAAQSVFKGLLY